MVNVFEGFMDFLSCCSFYHSIPVFNTIILNSLSFLPRIESLLHDSLKVNLFLDNDTAGRTATQKIVNTCGNVKDWAPLIYPDHKDFNEFLMNRWPDPGFEMTVISKLPWLNTTQLNFQRLSGIKQWKNSVILKFWEQYFFMCISKPLQYRLVWDIPLLWRGASITKFSFSFSYIHFCQESNIRLLRRACRSHYSVKF